MKPLLSRIAEFIPHSWLALVLLTASPLAYGSIMGTDVVNGDGTVTYSYVINNTSGPFDVSAWSLDFGFAKPDWNQLDVFTGGEVTVPNANWFANAGIPLVGLSAQDFLALVQAGDVTVGTSQIGFSFTSKFLPGNVTYYEFSPTGESITGTTIGPSVAVPEVSSLVSIAFAGLVTFGPGLVLGLHKHLRRR